MVLVLNEEEGVWSLFCMGRRVFGPCFEWGGGCLVLVLNGEEGDWFLF